jgi:hypothetical protein
MENENITPSQPQNPPQQEIPVVAKKEGNSMGALIGTIIIIVILILGGAYLWVTKIQSQLQPTPDAQTLNSAQPIPDNLTTLEQSAATPDPMVDQLKSQSPSDEISSIQADLNATDLNSIDKELQSI